MISFQKIYGLYGLKHHTMEINGDVTMETTISENRASQPIDQGLLTFATTVIIMITLNEITGITCVIYFKIVPLFQCSYHSQKSSSWVKDASVTAWSHIP